MDSEANGSRRHVAESEPASEEETMDAALQQQIETLRKLKIKQLKLRYRELFGEDSRSANHRHLFRRIAWLLCKPAPKAI